MKKSIFIISILFLILSFAVPVYAEETSIDETVNSFEDIIAEQEIIENISVDDEITENETIENVDTALDIENNELLVTIAASLQVIMYIVFIQFIMLWLYLIIYFVRKLAKWLGLGLI